MFIDANYTQNQSSFRSDMFKVLMPLLKGARMISITRLEAINISALTGLWNSCLRR